MAFRTNVLVCAGTGCVSGNSYATATALENELFKKGLAQEVQVKTVKQRAVAVLINVPKKKAIIVYRKTITRL